MIKERSFKDYLTTEVKTKGRVSPHTIDGYVRAINHFEKFLNGAEPTKQNIKEFILYTKENYAINSQTPIFGALRQYLRFIGWDKYMVSDLVKITATIETKTADDILSQEDIQALYNATKNDILANTILKCLYNSGLRRCELLALDIDDIQDGYVIVRNGKGKDNQPEEITPNQIFFDAVKEYLEKARVHPKDASDRALFLTPTTRERMSTDTIRRILLKAQYYSGIRPNKPITPHQFRASVITHMHNAGAGDTHIMELSRHKTFTALKRYVRPTREQKRATVDRFVPVIKESSGGNPTTLIYGEIAP
jgi:site-specific recombinase XerD